MALEKDGDLGLRLTLTGDQARLERSWFHARSADGYKHLGNYPIFQEGRLWLDGGEVLDAATGKLLSSVKTPSGKGIASNGAIVAGGLVIGVQDDGVNASSGGAGGLGIHRDLTLMATVARLGRDRYEDVRSCPIELLPATYTEPGKKAQVVALTGLDRHRKWYGWSAGYGTAFASGNRLFIRTFNTLYAFGAAGAPFTPSTAFAAP